jgi:hypothetical protein
MNLVAFFLYAAPPFPIPLYICVRRTRDRLSHKWPNICSREKVNECRLSGRCDVTSSSGTMYSCITFVRSNTVVVSVYIWSHNTEVYRTNMNVKTFEIYFFKLNSNLKIKLKMAKSACNRKQCFILL